MPGSSTSRLRRVVVSPAPGEFGDGPEDDEQERGETGDAPADQRDPAAASAQLDPGDGLLVERRRHAAMVGVNPSRTLKPR